MNFWVSGAVGNGGPGSLFGDVKDTSLQDHWLSSYPGYVSMNTWQHVAFTYDQTIGYGLACLYYDGDVVAQAFLGTVTPFTDAPLYFGVRPADAGAGYTFAGLMDEVGIYNVALSQAEIWSIYNAGSAGKCLTPAFTGLINVNFGGGASSQKTGPGAVGQAASDFWNYLGPNAGSSITNLSNADGTPSLVGVTASNLLSSGTIGSSDSMYNGYISGPNAQSGTLTLTNLPAGNYSVFAYSYDGNFSLGAGYGTVTTSYNSPPANPPPWVPWLHYASWTGVAVGPGQPLVLTVQPGQHGGCPVICGLQIAGLDPDSSGLPICWETEYFGHTGVSPGADPDNDGLSNLQEYIMGGNPNRAAVLDTGGTILGLQVFTPLK